MPPNCQRLLFQVTELRNASYDSAVPRYNLSKVTKNSTTVVSSGTYYLEQSQRSTDEAKKNKEQLCFSSKVSQLQLTIFHRYIFRINFISLNHEQITVILFTINNTAAEKVYGLMSLYSQLHKVN
jgi:hypothetical protein